MEPELDLFLKKMAAEALRDNVPSIAFETGEILQFFVQISQTRHILEIGCAQGFSTIFLAAAVREKNGRVLSCDISAPSFAKAEQNIERVHLAPWTELRFGDALQVIRPEEKFDLVFIDGEKKRTAEFFRFAATHLNPKGLILIDNTKKFPEKMQAFQELRAQEQNFKFFDILLKNEDTLTVAFRS